jgi:hypothetical protein
MSISFLKDILPWLSPPVVGAVIGYVTFDIAMRTLFRQRGTRSIGQRAVSNLLTTDSLRGLIHSGETRTQLSRGISSITEVFFRRPFSQIAAAGISKLNGSFQDFVDKQLRALFGSHAFIYAVREGIGRFIESLSARRLREMLGGPGLKAFVTGTVMPLLAEEKRRSAIAQSLVSLLGKNAGNIIDDALLAELAKSLEPHTPRVADTIVVWLKSADTRLYLSEKGRELLPRILEKLNVMQRFLLSAGQFDKRLTEKMPEIVDETVATLESVARDPAQQRRIVALLVDIVRDWRDGLAKDGLGAGLGGTLEHIVGRALEGLGDPASRDALFEGLLEKVLGGDPTIGGFARQTLGMQVTDLSESVSRKALEYLTKPETARVVSLYLAGWVERFLQDNDTTSVGTILHIDPARKEKLDAFLLQTILSRSEQSVPEIHRAIDLENRLVPLIRARIPWLDVFGAILGFIIGLFQLLLRWIGLT